MSSRKTRWKKKSASCRAARLELVRVEVWGHSDAAFAWDAQIFDHPDYQESPWAFIIRMEPLKIGQPIWITQQQLLEVKGILAKVCIFFRDFGLQARTTTKRGMASLL